MMRGIPNQVAVLAICAMRSPHVLTGTDGILGRCRSVGSDDCEDLGLFDTPWERYAPGLYVWSGYVVFDDEAVDDDEVWAGDIRPATLADLEQFGLVERREVQHANT